jgi:hypothetical protein
VREREREREKESEQQQREKEWMEQIRLRMEIKKILHIVITDFFTTHFYCSARRSGWSR